jgi:hypothetical protein
LADNIKLYLREIWRQHVDGLVWFIYGSLMGFCEKGNELVLFINVVEFADKLSSVAPYRLVTLVKAVLLPGSQRCDLTVSRDLNSAP